jgi:hypothetical protein
VTTDEVDLTGEAVSDEDVEQAVLSLFQAEGESGLVVTVHDGAGESASRSDAFRDLLESLEMHGGGVAHNIEIEPPDFESLQKALGVLGEKRVQRRLFERILRTFGTELLDPLAATLDTDEGGPLVIKMSNLRQRLLKKVERLHLTPETTKILTEDLRNLMNDDYLTMLAEHEEQVQRPLVKQLAQEALHLIGETFQRAFRHWHCNASEIAESVQHRLRGRHKLRESPVIIRNRIIEGLEEFLWVETSTELSGALGQLFVQDKYRGVVDSPPVVERGLYAQFAATCWEIIQDNC